MEKDLFEKIIKDKLSQIDKPVNPNLWSKIEPQLEKSWWRKFFAQYGWMSYAFLSTFLLGYVLFQNHYVGKDLDVLNKKLVVTEESIQPTSHICKNDTVYIYKTLIKSDNEKVSNKNNEKVNNKQYEAIIANLENRIGKLVNEMQTILAKNTAEKPNIIQEKYEDKIENLVKNIENSNQKVLESIEKNKEEIADKKKDTLIVPQKVEPVPSTKKRFEWPNIESRIGLIASNNLDNSKTVGSMFEWFFGEKISLSFGAEINNYKEIEYKNTKIFNQTTGLDFYQTYGSQLLYKNTIKDIYIKNTVLQLPLKINYYYPIKRNWDLVFNYGTHLDLKTYQTINVEYVIDNEDVYQKLNTKNSKEIFHNMIFGTGLQYRRNKMIFQLIPSLTYNFREIDFQKSGKSFTINGGMFLKLR